MEENNMKTKRLILRMFLESDGTPIYENRVKYAILKKEWKLY